MRKITKNKSRLPASMVDLLMLRAASDGEDYRAKLESKYHTLAATFGAGEYNPESGSPNAAINRLQKRGYLRTTGYGKDRTRLPSGRTQRRYIEITDSGREILQRAIDVLTPNKPDRSALSGPDRI
jgi:DNA-binding PadR family transcriptional regulator